MGLAGRLWFYLCGLTKVSSCFAECTTEFWPLQQQLPVLCRSLTDHELTNVGILDANHRRSILNKISGQGAGSADDFSNLMGDLDSVISSLECFSVVSVAWAGAAG